MEKKHMVNVSALMIINHLSIPQVFQEVEHRVDHTFSVHLSFLEIYNETIVDLLSSLKQGKGSHSGVLTVVEEPGGGVSVKGLSLHLVHNEEEALNLLFEVRCQVMRYFISLLKKIYFYLSKNSLFSSKQNSYRVVFGLLRAKVCSYLSTLLLTNWLMKNNMI